jgi:hypothetical protein
MLESELKALLERIELETGERVVIAPPTHTTGRIPVPLQSFYAACDGLEFSFLVLDPAAKLNWDKVNGWCLFGRDRLFSYCLCSDSEEPPFDLWDHDSGNEPSGAFETVAELIEEKYSDILDNDEPAVLKITRIPDGISLAKVVAIVKNISGTLGTGDLLGQLKEGHLNLPIEIRRDGMAAVRAMHGLGVECHLNLSSD